MNVSELIDIAKNIGMDSLVLELQGIQVKESQKDCDLVLPFVGEFSSGKTTLINALTDSKKLETATKPTTATIFEVHFGCDSCCADVFDEKGEKTHYEDIAELKNDVLADTPYVLVNDTSTRVPSTTVIVDTPGLSSPDPRHRQTLINFLPKADGIILVVDVNQQITKSLTDFVKMMKLSNRSLFLVITMCDTKATSEIEKVKKNIAENCEIDIAQVACVSAVKGDLGELYSLFNQISKDKSNILKKINEQRIANAIDSIKARINELLQVGDNDDDLENAIKEQQSALNRVNSAIKRLLEETRAEIDDIERNESRQFEDVVFQKLNTLAASNSNNYDAEALQVINNMSALTLNSYKDKVSMLLRNTAQQRISGEEKIKLQSLQEIDMSSLSINGVSYNLNLNSMGHEYDGWLKAGMIVAAGAIVIATAGGAAAAGGATAAGGTAAAGSAAAASGAAATAGGVAITGTEVALGADLALDAIQMNRMRKMQKAFQLGQVADKKLGQAVGRQGGVVDSLVGIVGQNILGLGKPQRMRAIHEYMDSSLMPTFKLEMNRIGVSLVNSIANLIQMEAQVVIDEKTNALQKLYEEKKANCDTINERKAKLRDLLTKLNN